MSLENTVNVKGKKFRAPRFANGRNSVANVTICPHKGIRTSRPPSHLTAQAQKGVANEHRRPRDGEALFARQSRAHWEGDAGAVPETTGAGFGHMGVRIMACLPLPGCRFPQCSGRGTHRGYCAAHAREQWQSSRPIRRIRGRALQEMRARLFQRRPWCAQCGAKATIRDHVIPLAEGGRDNESNEQPLCRSCSDIKTAREAQRGRQRARAGTRGSGRM